MKYAMIPFLPMCVLPAKPAEHYKLTWYGKSMTLSCRNKMDDAEQNYADAEAVRQAFIVYRRTVIAHLEFPGFRSPHFKCTVFISTQLGNKFTTVSEHLKTTMSSITVCLRPLERVDGWFYESFMLAIEWTGTHKDRQNEMQLAAHEELEPLPTRGKLHSLGLTGYLSTSHTHADTLYQPWLDSPTYADEAAALRATATRCYSQDCNERIEHATRGNIVRFYCPAHSGWYMPLPFFCDE